MELVILFGVILGIIVATVRFKVHPVFSLTLAAIVSGLLFGLSPESITKTIGEGFGKTLSSIGLVIAFGTVIGTFLEKTGGTKVLANAILKLVGLKKSPLALNLAGLIISIPVYCDSGFVILSSLNKALSKKSGIKILVFAIALATGLYSAHVFVPPTPGPLAAAAILEADLGMVMLFGLLVAICVSLMGYFWALFIGKRLHMQKDNLDTPLEALDNNLGNPPSLFNTLLPLFLPLILIALKSVAEYPTKPLGNGLLSEILSFLGNPIVALFIGVVLSFLMVDKIGKGQVQDWVGESLKQAGAIVLITGAGGGFGAILRTLDYASLLQISVASGLGGLFLAFGVAAVLKSAQGSSTVSIITTAAIVAPLLVPFGLEGIVHKALVVLAIGAGAMTVSHVNDSYFWVVAEFSKMDMKTALKGHTLATLFQGLTGIGVIILLFLLF
ncbi:MAG: GntP family permease [Bacteroidota bacterium]